jgi:PAS domain-containing protein
MIGRLLDRVPMGDWRGNLDGRPTFWTRTLLEAFGWRVSLHRMVATDDADCFHTHPAFALRIVLEGGYAEQLLDGTEVEWRPGMVGIVRPSLAHRISRLRNGRVSYSLWIRGPKRAPILLKGDGWSDVMRAPDV